MNGILKWVRKPLQYRTYQYRVVTVIIVINVIVFILSQLIPWLKPLLALNPIRFMDGMYWSVVTYMFTHAGVSHIFFNMLALYFFGTIIERTWGSNEFILMYGVIGVLSGIISLIIYLTSGMMNVNLLGASGAVFGIMLVYSTLYPEQKIYVFGIFPITAKILMLIFIGIQLLPVITHANSNIAYSTHLSGIAIAWLYLLIRHKIDPYKRMFGR